MITEKNRFQRIRRSWTSRLRAWRLDGENRRSYGEVAPQFAECLWIPLDKLHYAVRAGSSGQSGRVIDYWPADEIVPVRDIRTIAACLAHWEGGVSWEDTGIHEQMMDEIRKNGKVDRLRSFEEIQCRYRELDVLFVEVLVSRSLKTRKELFPESFREEGGILVHIGPDGLPYFGRKGHHRLALALAARVQCIPAQLGVVHRDGLRSFGPFRLETGVETGDASSPDAGVFDPTTASRIAKPD